MVNISRQPRMMVIHGTFLHAMKLEVKIDSETFERMRNVHIKYIENTRFIFMFHSFNSPQ